MRQSMMLLACAFLISCPGHSQVGAAKGESAELAAARKEQDRLRSEIRKLRREGKLPEAIAAAWAILALDCRLPGTENSEIVTSLEWLAELQTEHEDLASAQEVRRATLEFLQKWLGDGHWKVADARLALEDVDRLAEMDPERRRRRAEANTLNERAVSLHQAGKPSEALPLARRALAIRKEVLGERHPDYARSLANLAALLDSLSDRAAARPLYERVLAIRKEVLGERHPDYARSLDKLASLLDSQGDGAAARPLYERALAIEKEVLGERHPDYAQILNNLASLLGSQGDLAAARQLLERAMAILRETLGERHPDYARSLNNLAYLLQKQGDLAAARPLYERALAILKEVLGERHPDYAHTLSGLASVYHSQGDYAGAASCEEEAVAIAERNLGLSAAALSERQQLAMAQDLRYHLDAYLSLVPRAKVAAGQAYDRVVAAKGAVFERQRHINALRRIAQAGPGSEDARLFADLTATTNRLATLALAVPDPKQADAWRAEVAEQTRRKEELEVALAGRDAAFRAERAEARRTSEEVRASLPTGAALLDLLDYTHFDTRAGDKGGFAVDGHFLAFVIQRDRPVAVIDLGPWRPIAEAVQGWRAQLARPVSALDGPARNVRALVWEPLEKHLEGATTVLVSPDGALGRVPLAALPGKKEGAYLIEERTVVTVPFPRMLGGESPDAPDAPPALLLVGDVDYGGDPGASDGRGESRSAAKRAGMFGAFDRLKGTGEEADAIAVDFGRRYPGGKTTRLDGTKATEEALRREVPKHRFLHLATHGYFAPGSLRLALGSDPNAARSRAGVVDPLGGQSVSEFHPGLLSGIALAGANRREAGPGKDDGILTALDVASLDLSGCELAVLSACETGLGESAGGEGLLGLQRAFQVAGARNVVASLWRVSDERTRDLMEGFYGNLLRKGLSPSAALREAQLAMLRGDGADDDRVPPFYWAAFVLSTDRP
jgi:CHAT domain-containing protein